MSSADQGGAPLTAGGVLSIDLNALRANYRYLRDAAQGARCGAAVKADGYGLGIEKVALSLGQEGCRDFFVATPEEGAELRAYTDGDIYVFNGLLDGWSPAFIEYGLIPVLNDPGQIARWREQAAAMEQSLRAAIHVESGINRLGLTARQVEAIAGDAESLSGLDLSLIMSHLACGYDRDNPLNEAQRNEFERLRALLPDAPASLCNSAGVLLGEAYHFDVTRPGIALYGGRAIDNEPNPMKPVTFLQGQILQVREIDGNQGVGYGATFRTEAPARIATIGVGYGDGYLRILGNRTRAVINGTSVPVVGRVSMDLITLDVSDLSADQCVPGTLATLWGDDPPIDEIADAGETISYELLTRLGSRLARRYLGGDDGP